MPFCPKCKYEFVDGVKKCNECGCDLVDSLDELEDTKENIQKEEIKEERISEENMHDDTSQQNENLADILDEGVGYSRTNITYQKLSDKYEDIKSSAYTLILVGGVGLIGLILEGLKIIRIPASSRINWLFNSVLGGIFIIFFIAGIVSFMHAKKVKIEADIEDELISDIQKFAKENITRDIIDKDIDTAETIEILYFDRTEVIKNILMHEFESADERLVEELVENIYQKIYEEE